MSALPAAKFASSGPFAPISKATHFRVAVDGRVPGIACEAAAIVLLDVNRGLITRTIRLEQKLVSGAMREFG